MTNVKRYRVIYKWQPDLEWETSNSHYATYKLAQKEIDETKKAHYPFQGFVEEFDHEVTQPCENPDCHSSTSIMDTPTFGTGELDNNGFWEYPCVVCQNHYVKREVV